MVDDALEARGGVLGGADGASGQAVVVRLAGPVLEVFHETGSERFHTSMVTEFGLVEHPSPVGTALTVRAARTGLVVPVRFEVDERAKLEVIVGRVRSGR
ncbi:hypothetical protein G5V58_11240 [Nocardioides anomalus]|uniref:Uncharacterized protein n=1 Tax=Nocardioides anomalus TaxID=2712223 RepID=A0A6G6WDE6_9ACTN|nr:hypothetical protein [Nocardioides anomalus]QIG43254.1 hypothetical protein G5V58_11240 [Nocardioides anomalus]